MSLLCRWKIGTTRVREPTLFDGKLFLNRSAARKTSLPPNCDLFNRYCTSTFRLHTFVFVIFFYVYWIPPLVCIKFRLFIIALGVAATQFSYVYIMIYILYIYIYSHLYIICNHNNNNNMSGCIILYNILLCLCAIATCGYVQINNCNDVCEFSPKA